MLYIPEVAKNCTTTAVTLVVRVVTLQLELLSISKGELDVNELSKMITHLQVIAPMEDLKKSGQNIRKPRRSTSKRF